MLKNLFQPRERRNESNETRKISIDVSETIINLNMHDYVNANSAQQKIATRKKDFNHELKSVFASRIVHLIASNFLVFGIFLEWSSSYIGTAAARIIDPDAARTGRNEGDDGEGEKGQDSTAVRGERPDKMGKRASAHNTIRIRGGEFPSSRSYPAPFARVCDYLQIYRAGPRPQDLRFSLSLFSLPSLTLFTCSRFPLSDSLIWFRYPCCSSSREFANIDGACRYTSPARGGREKEKRNNVLAVKSQTSTAFYVPSRKLETKLRRLAEST